MFPGPCDDSHLWAAIGPIVSILTFDWRSWQSTRLPYFFGSQNQLLGMFHRFFCCLVLNNKRVERKSEESGPALHTTRIYLHKINCKSMRINPDYFSILVLNQLKFRMFTHELIFEYGEVSLSARWLLGVGPQWIISIIPSHLNIWSPFS